MKIRRYLKVNARGNNIYKFINGIHESRINCFGQYCKDDLYFFEIYAKDYEKLKKIAEEYNIELKSSEYGTVNSKLKNYRKRIGIVLGILIILSGVIYFDSIIMTIEIQGNKKVSDEAILYALESMGVKEGVFSSTINYIYCENKLMTTVDGLAWAGMHKTGNRLVVEVTEIVEKPEMFSERIPCNIFASKNAQIVSVSVYDGMLMRIIGDYVMQGDLLISGVTSDDTGHTTLHHAMGKIIGIYDEEVKFYERLDKKRSSPTGEENIQHELKLFNFTIPLFIISNRYESSITERIEKPLELFGKILPIKIITNKISETSETAMSEDELKEEINKKIYLYEKNFLNDDIEVLSRDLKWENDGQNLICRVIYSIKGDICEQREIFAK